MTPARSVEIVGGGLAGLSLGIALRKAGVEVTLFEAGDYPRHRVCGEFIAGLDDKTKRILALDSVLEDAHRHHTLAWHNRNRLSARSRLPSPALGISRHLLDQRLAERFVDAGGHLLTGSRTDCSHAQEGRVIASGRRRGRSPWIGLKAHVTGVRLESDLELHLAPGAYVGLSPVEDGRCNVCGLFRSRPDAKLRAPALPLDHYLQLSGLQILRERLAQGSWDATSFTAVAGLTFTPAVRNERRMVIGDSYAMIPPFTGNGMAMAFQSAACALGPLISWAKRELAWTEAVRLVDHGLRERFRSRLFVANALHRFLHTATPQRWFLAANQARLLPFRFLYGVLH